MTGYARAQGADDRRRWVWEARSVNGRNLEPLPGAAGPDNRIRHATPSVAI
jgi:hypothetical protein